MSRARWVTLAEAVASIPDDASIAPGGFMLGRAPMALIFELVRQGKRGLHLVSLPNPLPAEILVAAGAVRRLEFLFTAISLDGGVAPMPCLKRAIEAGALEWQEHDGYRVVQRLRAAAMGLPFLPVPEVEASAVAQGAPAPAVTDPFTGESRPMRDVWDYELDFGFRHDVSCLGVSYGANYQSFGGEVVYSDVFVYELYEVEPRIDAFVEKQLSPRLTLRAAIACPAPKLRAWSRIRACAGAGRGSMGRTRGGVARGSSGRIQGVGQGPGKGRSGHGR